jgi:hypothetical protein
LPDIESIIQQLERQRTAIDNAIEALRGVSGESQPAAKRRGRPPKAAKRSMSAAGRQRQIAAMRAYWAAKKAGGKKATKKAAKKRGLTAAGRKRLSDNMKRMWAEKKLGKKRKGG